MFKNKILVTLDEKEMEVLEMFREAFQQQLDEYVSREQVLKSALKFMVETSIKENE